MPESSRRNIVAGYVVLQEGAIEPLVRSDWREATLDQLGRIITGKTPSSRNPEHFGGNVLFVTPRDFDGRRHIDSTERFLTEKGANSVRGARIPSGAVMVSCIGSDMGKSAIAVESCVTNQQINSIVVDPENEPLFIYYNLSNRRDEIRGSAGGSAQPILNKSGFGQLSITLPPLPEQRAIAHVLGTLDDKIELNHRTAQALERLARAIFRAWFVDYEPVKAKAAGAVSFPSMSRHAFESLPTRFIDSQIGPVPRGWAVKAIEDVVTVKGGGTPSTKNPDYWDDGEHCWATPKDMSRLSHPVLLDTERHITDAGIDRISSGLLPVGTVLMSSRAPVGYLAIAGVPTAVNQGFIAMICEGPLPPVFVLNWAQNSMETIKARASGTTFPEISKKNFRPIPVVEPTDDVIAAYQQVVGPLFKLLTACVRENGCLAEMRDFILPRLLNGQVRVEAACG